jgi:hypothetical protein
VRGRLLIALMVAGAAAAVVWRWPAAPIVSTSPAAPQAAQAGAKDLPALPARASLGEPRGNLFGVPPAPAAPAPKRPAPQASIAPAPPPMPYRVAGRVVREGVSQLLLARDNTVFQVQEGDTLEGGYRVESIGVNEITLLYLPLGVREHLPLAIAP